MQHSLAILISSPKWTLISLLPLARKDLPLQFAEEAARIPLGVINFMPEQILMLTSLNSRSGMYCTIYYKTLV